MVHTGFVLDDLADRFPAYCYRVPQLPREALLVPLEPHHKTWMGEPLENFARRPDERRADFRAEAWPLVGQHGPMELSLVMVPNRYCHATGERLLLLATTTMAITPLQLRAFAEFELNHRRPAHFPWERPHLRR